MTTRNILIALALSMPVLAAQESAPEPSATQAQAAAEALKPLQADPELLQKIAKELLSTKEE